MTDAIRNPATLVAIVHAAHRSGNRDLERTVRGELLREFGIEIRIRPQGQTKTTEGASHAG